MNILFSNTEKKRQYRDKVAMYEKRLAELFQRYDKAVNNEQRIAVHHQIENCHEWLACYQGL